MKIEEAIKRYSINAEYERTHGNLQGCLEFKQLADWLKELKQLREQTRWIPVSERLPEAGEYVGDVAKYYLVQNEYGDMMVARYTHSVYWRQMYQLEPIDDEIVAWMELPQPYKAESEELKPKRRMCKGCENCKNYQNRICMMTGEELAMVCEEWEAKNEQG